jgi:hypothetical protein
VGVSSAQANHPADPTIARKSNQTILRTLFEAHTYRSNSTTFTV